MYILERENDDLECVEIAREADFDMLLAKLEEAVRADQKPNYFVSVLVMEERKRPLPDLEFQASIEREHQSRYAARKAK